MHIPMWSLYAREVKRFQKIWLDTVFSPIVSVGLYLAVFGIVSLGRSVDGIPYVTFVYVGLLTMMVINSSFSNPAFALIISKNVGNIIDLQLAPISPWRIGIAYALAAFTRGVITLIIALAATAWFIPSLTMAHPIVAVAALFLTGVQFGMLGVAFGFLAKNFEALTFMTTFVMQPMIFLAGVFYPISTLPGVWSTVSLFNPIHHNINLMRYAVLGYADVNPLISWAVIIGLSAALFIAMHIITKRSIHS